jgi:hypothetical protein
MTLAAISADSAEAELRPMLNRLCDTKAGVVYFPVRHHSPAGAALVGDVRDRTHRHGPHRRIRIAHRGDQSLNNRGACVCLLQQTPDRRFPVGPVGIPHLAQETKSRVVHRPAILEHRQEPRACGNQREQVPEAPPQQLHGPRSPFAPRHGRTPRVYPRTIVVSTNSFVVAWALMAVGAAQDIEREGDLPGTTMTRRRRGSVERGHDVRSEAGRRVRTVTVAAHFRHEWRFAPRAGPSR